MTYGFIKNFILNEGATTVEIFELPYSKRDLTPSISKATLDYHYDDLAKAYAKRYNAGEGDREFNAAGVYLHNTLFQQYQKYAANNAPTGDALEFIEKHFGSFAKFKDAFAEEAMKFQGSGWIYLARNGKIKTIKNHEIKADIVLLVDWWEHAWALDYQADKKDYLTNQWNIINWEHVGKLTNE
jgi:Fe-Mn family superoxide dismutase